MASNHLTARRLLLAAPRRLEWVVEELPAPGPGEVLVETRTGAISVGSELPLYMGTARSAEPPLYPRRTGYESVGIVAARGAYVSPRVRPGERVVAFYGHRSAALVPSHKVIPVPDDIPDPLALLAILTCDAAKGVRAVAPRPEEAALVTGAGALGLFALFILKAYGVANVDMVEPDERRHALARALGAREVLRPEARDRHEMYTVGFECSSRDAAFALLQDALVPGGRLCVLADGNLEPLTLTPAFHAKELRVLASSDGWDYRAHAAWYFDYLRRSPAPLADVFQLSVAADELPATFERLARREVAPVKVLVRWG